ncbi:DUF4254 domain-containing protein [Acidicapsa dinghuensis]|uniref:DUF4254 domain-containing protein n=1 Tax=Acidicapsa dinghuensis TaxID=2218256 RepID=A0ABW1EN59_9BACT|nr:DUF4254 domain-containing protein [Acidicapsa dinghuensis]
MLNLSDIPDLHDQLTVAWHREALEAWQRPLDPWSELVARQHLANFELWHTEDEARTPEATDADLARVKRRIDSTNQRRNDLSEQIDQLLLEKLATAGMPNETSPLHSESPGLMIDRLSILALKLYHTREEMERPDAPQGHFERNQERLAILAIQRNDLAACLVRLWEESLSGTRRFKLYRQLKMYNDPSLNPSVYRNS